MKGFKLRKIVGLMLLALCAAGVLVAHVWKQNTYVRLSKEAVKLARQQGQLRNHIALLELGIADLRKFARLERLAKGSFGLEYGNMPIPVYAEGKGSAGGEEDYEGNAFGGPLAGNAGGGPAAARPPGIDAGKVAWPTKGL
jgi:hypothetical protein